MAKSKSEKFAELRTFSHVIQARFDEVFRKDYKLKGNWSTSFFKNNHPIVLELGCGRGEYTVALAEKFPSINFIGVDIKGARLYTGAVQALEKGLKNLAFIRTQIEFIESFFAADEVDEIWLTFPDPQMRYARRRLVATRFLSLYQSFLKPGGIIHLKTDSNFLYTYTRAMTQLNELVVLNDYEDLYNSGFADDILSIQTYYEARFMSHGIPIKYFSFLLDNEKTLVEPDVDIPLDGYRNIGRDVKFDDDAQEQLDR